MAAQTEASASVATGALGSWLQRALDQVDTRAKALAWGDLIGTQTVAAACVVANEVSCCARRAARACPRLRIQAAGKPCLPSNGMLPTT